MKVGDIITLDPMHKKNTSERLKYVPELKLGQYYKISYLIPQTGSILLEGMGEDFYFMSRFKKVDY
jgi:hypothetical protein